MRGTNLTCGVLCRRLGTVGISRLSILGGGKLKANYDQSCMGWLPTYPQIPSLSRLSLAVLYLLCLVCLAEMCMYLPSRVGIVRLKAYYW